MFKIDDKDIKRLESDLKTFKRRALPFATKNTLNQAAFLTQFHSKRKIRRGLTLRNKYTEQSIRVEQAKTLNIRRQFAVVGSIAPYMEDQEFGGIKRKRGSEGVPIATAFSAGEGRANKRSKMPRKPNKLQNIKLRRKHKRKMTNKQALIVKVSQAVNSGNRYIFHDFQGGKKKGIFKVVGGRKGIKRGWPGNARIEMVWDMSEPSVSIPKNPWLAPSVAKVEKRLPQIYRKSLEFQIKKHNILR